jgi:hypothetical protein
MRYSIPFILTLAILLGGCARHAEKAIAPVTDIKNSRFFDVAPESKKASYLYAPGLMGSELIMGRFCPSFTSSITGERISWRVGGHVIGQPHSAVTFPEIDLKKPTGFTLNPIRAFMNSIRRDMYPLTERFMHERYGITVIDNPQSPNTVVNYNFNLGAGNIAQEKDIKALQATYAKHIQKYPDTDVILYGDSRGATTIFNFIALENPTQVKAAVLEAPFDSMPHVIKHCIYSDKDHAAEKRLTETLSLMMRSYKKSAPSPRDYAELIRDDIPLLFITSLKDWIVPPQCTMYLYNRLKERGLKDVHILVLEHPTHPGYMLDHEGDKNIYESVVHAFYKHYNLPHNAAKAAAGKDYFARTQPAHIDMKVAYTLSCCAHCV